MTKFTFQVCVVKATICSSKRYKPNFRSPKVNLIIIVAIVQTIVVVRVLSVFSEPSTLPGFEYQR